MDDPAMLVDLAEPMVLPVEYDEYERLAAESLSCGGQPTPEWTPPSTGIAETIEAQAARYEAWDTELGDLIAEHLRTLAGMVRWVKAETPGQYRDRMDALEDWEKIAKQG